MIIPVIVLLFGCIAFYKYNCVSMIKSYLRYKYCVSELQPYRNYYELEYMYQNNRYSLILPRSRKVPDRIKIVDSDGNDISDSLFCYAGPDKNFFNLTHNMRLKSPLLTDIKVVS